MDASGARGRALFQDARVGCASCHGGSMGTNNQTMDVGTGAAFQVPALRGLAWRAPLMHDRCAPTLRARVPDPRRRAPHPPGLPRSPAAPPSDAPARYPAAP